MDLTPSGDDKRPEDDSPDAPDSRSRIDWSGDDDDFAAPAPGGEPEPTAPDDALAWAHPQSDTPLLRSRRRRSTAGVVSAVLMLVLALGIVAATLWGVREYRQRALIQNAAQQAVALIAAGAPGPLQQEMSAIQGYLTSGQADLAAQRLATLRSGLEQRPGSGAAAQPPAESGEPIPESAYKDLPEDAARFFRTHQDLFRQFLIMCAQGRQLKEQGKNVDGLREVRDRVIESARLGQQPAVEQGMQEFARMLQAQGAPGPGAGGGGGRGPLAHKAQRLKQEVERAAGQGRDVRPVFALMQQAEQAAQAGKLDEAEKFLDQALEAVRKAPRGGRFAGFRGGGRGDFGPRMMGMRRPGGGNSLAPFVRALLGVMGAEEANLKAVTDDLLQMRSLLLAEPAAPATDTPTAAQELKPIIDRAMGEMQTVSKRRQELTKMMRGPRDGHAQGPIPPGDRRQQLTPEQRREMMVVLTERLSPVLENIRALSADEYVAQRPLLIREIVRAVMEPPKRPDRPEVSRPADLPSDPEQRVRAKMLEASKVYAKWEIEGKDTAAVEALFAQARKALYAKQFAEAEKLVDEACKLLGMTDAPPNSATGPAATDTGDVKLDLRARP